MSIQEKKMQFIEFSHLLKVLTGLGSYQMWVYIATESWRQHLMQHRSSISQTVAVLKVV